MHMQYISPTYNDDLFIAICCLLWFPAFKCAQTLGCRVPIPGKCLCSCKCLTQLSSVISNPKAVSKGWQVDKAKVCGSRVCTQCMWTLLLPDSIHHVSCTNNCV